MKNHGPVVTLVGLLGLALSAGIARAQAPDGGVAGGVDEETAVASPEGGGEEEAAVAPEPPSTPPPRRSAAPSCAERAHDRSSASVVRVASGDRAGVGVVVVDSRHVVTALFIVRDGRSVDVTDGAGNAREARIVLTADDDGLALLELDTALPGAPLAVAPWEDVQVGRRVVALGVPAPGTRFPWTASEGIVSARGEREVQTDARITEGPGSPLLDCEGRVVALARPSRMRGEVEGMPAVPAIADIASRADHDEGYGGRWDLTGGLTLAGAYEDPAWLWGIGVTLGIIALDRIFLIGRFHYMGSSEDPTGTNVLSLSRTRIRGDAYAGWRQIVRHGESAWYFELGLGASVTWVHQTSRSADIVDPGTGPVIEWTDTETEAWSVRPMAVASILRGPLIISYTFEVDIDREHVVHLFDLGVRF
jgi:hypothetical protein